MRYYKIDIFRFLNIVVGIKLTIFKSYKYMFVLG
nr:MAG TPA: hypothetical protein [Caudoviricetes sp.]